MLRRLFFAVAMAFAASAASAAVARSATLAVDGAGSVVALNRDSGTVSILEVSSGQVLELPVCSEPETVSVAGVRAFVACADGMIVSLDLPSRRVVARRDVGVPLFGIVTDGARLFVTAPAAGSLLVLDASLATVRSLSLPDQPRGVALRGEKLYLTHFTTGALSIVETETLRVEKTIATGLDHNLSQALWIEGAKAYLPQTRSNSTNPALLFDTTVFPVVSVIDLASGENLVRERISIDVADRPVNMPLDAVIAAGKLYVVNAGSDDVSVIDLTRRTATAHLPMGSNPRGIALSPDERRVYVNNSLSGTISIIDTAVDRVIDEVVVTTIPLAAGVLNGKKLFHTSNRTTLSKDRWISCATCHFDGGADGRTWFFRDGPRNSTALFGVGETLPMHWSGDLDELQDVENTVRLTQAGSGLAHGGSNCDPACDLGPPNSGRSADLDDLAAFMRSLRPARHPNTYDRVAAARGATLFFDPRTACSSCHVAPLYTDRVRHDVGTGRGASERKGTTFDTPSLRGLHLTAPYFHDGSAATLADVVDGAAGQHGDTRMLTVAQKNDLVEFLRSVDFDVPRRRAVRP